MTSAADSQSTTTDLQKQAEAYLNQQHLQQAATLCEQIIKEEPDFAPAYQTLGKALHLAKQFQKAEKCYLKAVALDPNYAIAYTNLGSLYGEQQQFQNALACYRKALELQPRAARTYRNLARVWSNFGDSNRAIEAWFRAYGLEPATVPAEKHIELGDKLFQENHIEKAIACYRRAIQVNPNHQQALENLGVALKRAGEEIATARSHFIIFTRGRTGSTTLVKLLNAHPDIDCQPEPFHQDYGFPFQEQYLSAGEKDPGLELDSERSRNSQHWVASYPLPVLDQIIAEVNQQHKNGIKHLPYSISFDQNLHLLMNAFDRVIFLNRRNKLKRIVSLHISLQAGQFQGDRNKLFEKQYQPLDVEELRRHMNWEERRQNQYRTIARSLGKEIFDLDYEDFLDPSLTRTNKMNKLNEVYRYLGFSEITEARYSEKIQQLLDPNQNQFNDRETYRLIPNIEQIEEALGSEETGYLFD